MLLSAKEILDVADFQEVTVDIPEWRGSVRLRSLTAADAAKYVDSVRNNAQDSAIMLFALSCVDERGQRIFTYDDLPALREKQFRVILRLQNRLLELNGLRDSAKTEEIAKNDSGEADSGDLPTASPVVSVT